MQYFSIAYENDFECELRTAAFIRGKLFTQTHSTQILQSGPFSPRQGTGAECINSTFMDCLLHAAGHQDCKQRIKHDDNRYRKKKKKKPSFVIYRIKLLTWQIFVAVVKFSLHIIHVLWLHCTCKNQSSGVAKLIPRLRLLESATMNNECINLLLHT